jgi:predicted Na+-dependent transporter
MNKSSNTENKTANRLKSFINAIIAMFRAILKSELTKISGFVIILIIALMLAMPFLLSSKSLKSNLQNKITTITGGIFTY